MKQSTPRRLLEAYNANTLEKEEMKKQAKNNVTETRGARLKPLTHLEELCEIFCGLLGLPDPYVFKQRGVGWPPALTELELFRGGLACK